MKPVCLVFCRNVSAFVGEFWSGLSRPVNVSQIRWFRVAVDRFTHVSWALQQKQDPGEGAVYRAQPLETKDIKLLGGLGTPPLLNTSRLMANQSALESVHVDLCREANTRTHYTDKYEDQTLVIRRGTSFIIKVGTNVPYDPAIHKHRMAVLMSVGATPMVSKGSVIRMDCSNEPSSSTTSWHASIKALRSKLVQIKIFIPANAMIGRYRLYLESFTSGELSGSQDFTTKRKISSLITVIFNPWSTEDAVYLPSTQARQEYVLNENGLIYVGTKRDIKTRSWYYGQFEAVTLDTALYLLEEAEISSAARRSPTLISRILTKMSNHVNQQPEIGVLMGWWEDGYDDGTPPWQWASSVTILDEFMKHRSPVRYGQCWAFAGLLTTLCRTLGIPSRTVSGFEAAHDTDGSMTIDFHWTEAGEPVEEFNQDKIWNFHVWTECWFKRPDLPAGYDGWQALDATPQENSEGAMQCGPASVNAIKNGDINLPFDAKFVFAVVNGDKYHWLVKGDGTMSVIDVDTAAVGQLISTKGEGKDARVDLTKSYKYDEGSAEERVAVHKALAYSERPGVLTHVRKENQLDLKVQLPDSVRIGDTVKMSLLIVNRGAAVKRVQGFITPMTCFYTGAVCKRLMKIPLDVTVKANSSEELTYSWSPDLYLSSVEPNYVFTTYAMVHTEDGAYQTCAAIHSTNFRTPGLTVMAPEVVKPDKTFNLEVEFENTSPFLLNGGVFSCEARGINRFWDKYMPAIKPGETVKHRLQLRMSRPGEHVVAVSFTSDKVAGLHGFAKVKVEGQAGLLKTVFG